jgi:uncharacterized protein YggU (UPF0235/DUF167 family)
VHTTEHTRTTTSDAVRVRVRVAAGARRSEVVGRYGDAWKLRVHAAPERSRANDEVVELLAGALGLRKAQVRVVVGHTARDKVVELDGIGPNDVERLLSGEGR